MTKETNETIKNLLLFTIVIFAFCITAIGQIDKDAAKPQKQKKITSEEVVSKHLASIGSAEALASVKSRIMVGTARASSQLIFAGQFAGAAQFASEGDKVLFAMIFDSRVYPYEKAAYDGQDITVGKQEGERSVLGDFLKSKDVVFKQGLVGGVLSSAWSLLDINSKKPKLQYAGAEKINNRQVYKLKYIPSKGGDLNISLYFDAETFQHLRSEYKYVIPARIGTRPGDAIGQNNQSDSTYTLTEEFGDFKTEGQLTLPHAYSLRLTIDAQSTRSVEWDMNFSRFVFNQPLDVTAFKVS